MEGEARTALEGENPFPPIPVACLEAGDGSRGLPSPGPVSVRISSLAGYARVMIKLHESVSHEAPMQSPGWGGSSLSTCI